MPLIIHHYAAKKSVVERLRENGIRMEEALSRKSGKQVSGIAFLEEKIFYPIKGVRDKRIF